MTRPGPQTQSRRLCAYSLGFLHQRRIRRILQLSGYRLTTGWPGARDAVAVWGQRPVSWRGRWIAKRSGAELISLEDGFLRSVYPGAGGAPPISIVIDDLGIYFDASAPSRLEVLLDSADLDELAVARARRGIELLKTRRLSKYTPPSPRRDFGTGYVLVIDQTAGDASIAGAGAGPLSFKNMLDAARSENPGAEILVKTHPDVISGKRAAHFKATDMKDHERLVADDVNPWDLIDGAKVVYTVSSQMGYEAVLAGKDVRCFGTGFYSGWGLTEDEVPCSRRSRQLSVEELFTGCHLQYPVYYGPWHDRLCEFEQAVDVLTCLSDAEADSVPKGGEVFLGVRRWKRANLKRFRPQKTPAPVFANTVAQASEVVASQERALWVWASKFDKADLGSVDVGKIGFIEDGFLRSVGLGAELTEAASLVFDRSGIYFDPSTPSDLENLIAKAVAGKSDRKRAAALREQIIQTGVTKYNVGHDDRIPDTTGKKVVLVPGQVEDDASIQRGCGVVRTNLDLLKIVREKNPDAWIVFKPHPDVEAGLRQGAIADAIAADLADEIATNASPNALLKRADEVWTMTSLMGFEALLRGLSVTCLGTPFYAGWGLTTDLGDPLERRSARPNIDDLTWATLIAYPSYRDPVSGLPCPPELIVERLASGTESRQATFLSRLQGMMAGYSWIWR